MKCIKCLSPVDMLIMMNTTRPPEFNINARYLCCYCGSWCTVKYEPISVKWDDEEGTFLDIDNNVKDSELYFVGRHIKNESK